MRPDLKGAAESGSLSMIALTKKRDSKNSSSSTSQDVDPSISINFYHLLYSWMKFSIPSALNKIRGHCDLEASHHTARAARFLSRAFVYGPLETGPFPGVGCLKLDPGDPQNKNFFYHRKLN